MPSTSFGSSSLSRRSSPSSSDQRWRHATDGTLAPASSSASAASNARRRGVPAASAAAASSPVEHERLTGERGGALDRVVVEGMAGAASTATDVDSAIRLGANAGGGSRDRVWCAAPRIRGPRSEAWSSGGISREASRIGTPRVPSIEAERGAVSIHVPPYGAVKRVIPWVLGVVILTAVVAIGLSQAGGNKTETAAEQPAVRPRAGEAGARRRAGPAGRSCTRSRPSCSRAACPRSSGGSPSSRARRS